MNFLTFIPILNVYELWAYNPCYDRYVVLIIPYRLSHLKLGYGSPWLKSQELAYV